MKKITFTLLIAIIVASCCDEECIAQIPPQPAYVDSLCTAAMPNVIPNLIITDNCELSSVVQIPLAGTIISPPLVGEVIATDASGNVTRVSFQVVKMDTISPVITWDEHAPIALKEGFDEASDHYTKFIAWIKYDTNRLFYLPEYRVYLPDSSATKVWYNSIALHE